MLRRIEAKGPDFFPTAVRHMDLFGWISIYFSRTVKNVWPTQDLERIIPVCTGVEHLLIIGDLTTPPLFPMVQEMRPTRLFMVVDLKHKHLDFTRPFFQSVSHLAIGELDRPRSPLGEPIPMHWRHWPALLRLPLLTHLALVHDATPDLVDTLFGAVPRLEILVILAEDAAAFSENVISHDPRLVILELDSLEAFQLPSGTRAVNELWTWAEDFVERKRRGEIELSHYCMELGESAFGRGRDPWIIR
ncbi:hypothetical protein C8R44DRAFT_806309 [Mycena epipterygia]|nr:hypothetical protein C8R44DRAFT_806309 [Mycena epipterygia]